MASIQNIIFERRLADGSIGILGAARQTSLGWKFFPANQRKPSRKFHETMESCLPRWLNYPDACQSRVASS